MTYTNFSEEQLPSNIPPYPGTPGQLWTRPFDQKQFRYTDITDELKFIDVSEWILYPGYNKDTNKVYEWIPINHIKEQTKGPEGLDGLRGLTGRKGLPGEGGLQGPQGATGPKGATGATGPDGEQGAPGPFGERGPTIAEEISKVPDDYFVEQRGAIFMTKAKDNNRIFIATGL